MAVYFVTGKLGSGKTLAAVGRIRDYLRAGKPVATNLDLNLAKLLGPNKRKTVCYRLPDKPTARDLDLIGIGNTTYDETKNGLVVLDECATWFNSRSWNDKGRAELIEWFLYARKRGWDIIFVIQDISVVDKQAREMLAEFVVYCLRLDRLPIPIIGAAIKLMGLGRLLMPKIHIGVVRYGDQRTSLVVDRWWYQAKDLYRAYDTKQVFRLSDDSTYQVLPSWYTKGRYMKPRGWWDVVRITRRFFIRRPFIGSGMTAAAVTCFFLFHAPGGMANAVTNSAIEKATIVVNDSKTKEELHRPAWAKDLRISGMVKVGTERIAYFENSDGTYSDAEFKERGLSVRIVGDCSAVVRDMEYTANVICGVTQGM